MWIIFRTVFQSLLRQVAQAARLVVAVVDRTVKRTLISWLPPRHCLATHRRWRVAREEDVDEDRAVVPSCGSAAVIAASSRSIAVSPGRGAARRRARW